MTNKKNNETSLVSSMISAADSFSIGEDTKSPLSFEETSIEKEKSDKDQSILRIKEGYKKLKVMLDDDAIDQTLKEKGTKELREISRRLSKLLQKLS